VIEKMVSAEGIFNLQIQSCRTATVFLPFGDVHEFSSGTAKGLGNPHRQPHPRGEFRDTNVRELARGSMAVKNFETSKPFDGGTSFS
jgi:hypothetical protein